MYRPTDSQLAALRVLENSKAVTADLKPTYRAATLEAAETALEEWDERYPAVSQIWFRHWENIIPIFRLPDGNPPRHLHHQRD
jgi:transposase-like protein